MENNDKRLPELTDIINRIMAFNIVHPEGCFLFRFVGYKDSDEICPDCGKQCMCEFDEGKSALGICGDIITVREMLNELREVAEDNIDENGVVIV